jgi:hypothetical protein
MGKRGTILIRRNRVRGIQRSGGKNVPLFSTIFPENIFRFSLHRSLILKDLQAMQAQTAQRP